MDIAYIIDLFLHLDRHLDVLINTYGLWIYAILFLVIFAETGLVVTPFLPGDSLLFIAGAAAALGGMNPYALAICLFCAATLGDSCNYWLGRYFGMRLFNNPHSKLFRRDYLQRTEQFYAEHGAKTVTLARFLPILRTFAPFVAGIGKMPYSKFLSFSMLGSLFWIGGLITLGYQFGNVPWVKQNLTLMIILIIFISFLPMIVACYISPKSKN